ncbi:MAG: hypothetical protein COS85_02145 [Armatimonadetes bacterium CG07_land_8_20_14_0_80_59_28]|nr:MAG: hypothetical protein COS85_02145 [Armatimonadetes bacterium CG07_land_8_20_14_0_80_59_28]PIY48678.1 MAG: hypothetical protein COZ05_02535 [Armatimonadetes bacterium CG_4_10_14_3_um_filter_59_10]PJB62551.1 MAG: hypothetical protein CO095_18300 [Armatimonadetes bacterium CG_4_9_14_3_um_filter_58_7]
MPEFPQGTRGFLILDDSVCSKTGKKMKGAGWLKGEDGKKNEFGHDVVAGKPERRITSSISGTFPSASVLTLRRIGA